MGYYKERFYNKGLTPVGKSVCSLCFEDYAVQDFIKRTATQRRCSYCRRFSKHPIAADVASVIEFILEGVLSEYREAGDAGVPYETAEGGWQLSTMDTWDLIYDDACELGDLSEELKHDVWDGLPNQDWSTHDPFGLPISDEWKFDWKTFCDQVKYRTRFVFFRTRTINRRDSWMERRNEPYKILYSLGRIVEMLGLFKRIPKGTVFTRVRCHEGNKSFSTAKELGPPKEALYSNRMSPAGIVMFYGALDEKTAIKETFSIFNANHEIASIAQFQSLKDLTVLDLTNLPRFPSMFDPVKRHTRPAMRFLQSFVTDATQAVSKDGREHIDYVPTQVVTEYFTHVFRYRRKSIDGIFYPSSKIPSGTSCVLFCEGRHCCEPGAKHEKHMFLKMQPIVKKVDLRPVNYAI